MFEKLFRKKEVAPVPQTDHEAEAFTAFTHQIHSFVEAGDYEGALEHIKYAKMEYEGKGDAKLLGEVKTMEQMVIDKLKEKRKEAA